MAALAPRVPVFLNEAAGPDATDPHELAARLGSDMVDVRAVQPHRLAGEIRTAVEAGTPIVGVAGGDGTLRSAAAIIAGSSTILACIPTGTLNHFARRNGVHDIDDAAAALRRGESRTLPVGTVQDDIFLNTLTFGEYSRIVRMRERFRGLLGKWPAAAVAFAIALATIRRVRVTLSVEDARMSRKTPFVWVGIGWGSFPRVHEAAERRSSPDLEIAVLRSQGLAGGLGFLLRLGVLMIRRHQPVRDRALEVLHARAMTLDSPHRIDATMDGEVVRLQPPVEVGIRDAALHVLRGPRHLDDDGPGTPGTVWTPASRH
jgi:diacylglycerol kinase family enzyme